MKCVSVMESQFKLELQSNSIKIMQIIKSTDPQVKPSTVMLVYGAAGVGKTTFASTAPKPLLVDCENGAKYFGLRGIKMDIAKVNTWSDMNGLFEIAKSGEYETIILDPLGELMEKLKRFMITTMGKKYAMDDGSPTIAGWGWLKDTMRSTIKILRDSGVNLLIIAHVEEKESEGLLVKRPKVMTKLSEEILGMMDVVGLMQTITIEGELKRVIRVQPSDTFEAKDRTGQLGQVVPPNFAEIVDACQGTKTFKWSNPKAVAKKEEPAEEAPKSTTDTVRDKMKTATKKKATKAEEPAETIAQDILEDNAEPEE